MCPVKGGARQKTIFDTVRMLIEKGLTIQEAIEEVESKLHLRPYGGLSEELKARIYQECL